MAPIDIMNLSFVHCGSGGGRKEVSTNIMQTHAAMKDTSCKHIYVFHLCHEKRKSLFYMHGFSVEFFSL